MPRLDGPPGSHGTDILPADKIENPETIVGGRVHRVEGFVTSVGAQAVAGSKDRIAGETVFRSLGNIRRLTLTNLGLSHPLGKNIRYTMFMGADIAEGLSEAQRFNRRKSNLFGLGYEDDEKVTVGCSFKGRFWSYKIAFDLSEWIDWCAHVGKKLLDGTIDTDAVFAHVIKAKRIGDSCMWREHSRLTRWFASL